MCFRLERRKVAVNSAEGRRPGLVPPEDRLVIWMFLTLGSGDPQREGNEDPLTASVLIVNTWTCPATGLGPRCPLAPVLEPCSQDLLPAGEGRASRGVRFNIAENQQQAKLPHQMSSAHQRRTRAAPCLLRVYKTHWSSETHRPASTRRRRRSSSGAAAWKCPTGVTKSRVRLHLSTKGRLQALSRFLSGSMRGLFLQSFLCDA